MTRRPPNHTESALHQAALANPRREITARQVDAVVPDPAARQNALNFLLAVGLFKSLTTPKGELIFRAASKDEVQATKGLSGEEALVYNHIKIAGNEGIWTKHLKAKTSLHQTVLDRCLKTLTQKRLIKRVPSVQHITRKIYMLEGLEPSISLTGGPWYTDNELDTEFIQKLTEVCYELISAISFPRRKGQGEATLYPISNAPRYPTAEDITNSLRKSRLTETNLTVEHVEMLLNVLILDGKVEKIPSFGTALWNPDSLGDGESSDEDADKRSTKKKRKHESDDELGLPKKRKKSSSTKSDDDDKDPDDSSSSERPASKKRKKKKNTITTKKRSKKSSRDTSDSEAGSSSKRRKKRNRTPESDSSDSDGSATDKSASDTGSDDDTRHRKSSSKKKRKQRSPSADFSGLDAGWVYRALKDPTHPAVWSEAPCGLCPSFDFCKEGGPVNPRECAYYDDWLAGPSIAAEETT